MVVAFILAVVSAQGVHKPNKDAVIKTSSQTSDLDGNYQYQFESSNGISSNEGGVAGQIVQGSTTWIAQNGEPLAISFIADENGYRPMVSNACIALNSNSNCHSNYINLKRN